MVRANRRWQALAELRVNRPLLANRHIRNLLRTYGGATNIGELNPNLYFAVFVAAGALGPVCAPVQRGWSLDMIGHQRRMSSSPWIRCRGPLRPSLQQNSFAVNHRSGVPPRRARR